MATEIVGREAELRSLDAFFEKAIDRPIALVLEGEPGIGKSTLWLAAVDEARERRLRVLSSRPTEGEHGLALTGLGDLFEGILDDVLPALPQPRRRALEIALLLEQTTDPADPRALGVAVRSVIEVLSSEAPLVLAVDDVQWLDSSSESALSFAMRRVRGHVRLVLTRRAGDGRELSEVERALTSDVVERLRVGPLSLGAIQKLLHERLQRDFSRPTLVRIHETSGGNPFYALELARALGTDADPTLPLPLPGTLEQLLEARLAGLPVATREALVLVAALGSPQWRLLMAAGVDAEALEPALAARVIERAGWEIRFTHPLLASVLYQGLSSGERRRAHRSLSDVVVDPLEQARHLALSTDGPDPAIANALERSATIASARGAPLLAAELSEHALRLTPVDAHEDEHRRTIAAGRAHMAAGEVERARTLGRALEARGPTGRELAEALIFLADLEPGRIHDRIALRRRALREASMPPELCAVVHQRLALEVRFTEGVPAALRHASAAVELARQLDDDGLRAGSLASLALLRFTAGKRDALRLAQEAHDLAAALQDRRRQVEAAFCLAHVLVWSAEHVRARAVLEGLEQEGNRSDERVTAQALWYRALVELRDGRLEAAAECAGRARELSVQYARDDTEDPQNLFAIALTAAHRGDLDSARQAAARGRQLGDAQGALLPGLAAVAGLIEAWTGDLASAVELFAAADRSADAAGWREPALSWWRADYVEALLALGRVDDAVAVLEPWETEGVRLGRGSVLSQVARCRGLVAAARSDLDGARRELERAAEHAAVGDPVGHARTLLALGVVRRRARQKRTAREAIEEALAIFETCGAARWAEKARTELGHIGGRTRERGLTAAERRVAALVSEGRTNREVAAALFLGERTVETHLSHIYSKLGVRSRAELARTYRSD